MMKNTLRFSALLALTLAACSSGGAGVEVRATTSALETENTPLVFMDDNGGAFNLQSARLRLRHIELDLPDGSSCSDIEGTLVGAECDGGNDKIRINGPFEVDLITGESTNLGDVVIPEGLYKRIDFRVEDGADDVAFAATARFDHNGDALTLDLSLDFNEDIRIEDPAGISVSADTDLIAAFVVTDWLSGVDIGACIEDGDVGMVGATVVIDDASTSGSCSAIEDTIKRNMKLSGQLDRN